MAKDGPPISSGLRFGGLNALRAKLPQKALNPRGVVTETDARARRALADFAAYPDRTKSIGQPAPVPLGISGQRATVLKKIRELECQSANRKLFAVEGSNERKLWLFLDTDNKRYFFQEEDLLLGVARRSILYRSKRRAMQVFERKGILWKERFDMPS